MFTSNSRTKTDRVGRHLLKGVAAIAVLSLTATPAFAQLESALNTAKASSAASQASQQRVEQLDDEADQATREYRAVLQQVDNLKLFVDQQDLQLQSQDGDLQSLRDQLGTVEQIKQGLVPMMLRMAAELEDSIEADIPFKTAERQARLERVFNALQDPNVVPTEQYRLLLNAYEIETNYGYQLDSYQAAHPSRPGNVVNYLRYGRTSFVYMTKDESEIALYNASTNSWDVLGDGDALSMRAAMRIANEQAAPGVVMAPVIVSGS